MAETAETEGHGTLRPGARVGRYEIVSVLGQGGFGITYRARDAELDRDVAIKEYLPVVVAVRTAASTVVPRSERLDEEFRSGRERFVAEGRTLATLHRAPGIVHVFDFLQANGTAYIVMELVAGDTLQNRLKRAPLTAAEAERILWPLLDGLEQVHEAGFLHRDIKPANLLLDARGNPTLIDFGAARMAMAGGTAGMTAIFTPGYAAVEQFAATRQGPWTDIYGVAATMHHAITGRVPPNAIDRVIEDFYKPLAGSAPPGFPAGLLAGIDAGLAVKATDRPQSIAAWRSVFALPAYAGPATVVLPAPTGAVTVALPSRSTAPPKAAANILRKGLWLGVAAVAALASALGVYFFFFAAGPKIVAPQTASATTAAPAVPPPTFDPSEVPFVPRSFQGRLEAFQRAPGAKALAINIRGYYGMATQRPSEEEARRVALEECESTVRRSVRDRQAADRCAIYVVGDTIDAGFIAPPMPPAPFLAPTRPVPPIPFDPWEIAFLDERTHRTLIRNYLPIKRGKALAIGRKFYWHTSTSDQEYENIRRALHTCGYTSGRQCFVAAIGDFFAVRLPEGHRMIEVLVPDDVKVADPRDAARLERYFVADDWRALAVASNGRIGIATNQAGESQAVAAALADCARTGGAQCALKAIGPFLVTPMTASEAQKYKEERVEARRRAEAEPAPK